MQKIIVEAYSIREGNDGIIKMEIRDQEQNSRAFISTGREDVDHTKIKTLVNKGEKCFIVISDFNLHMLNDKQCIEIIRFDFL